MSDTATVSIKYVNPVKEGKKYGNIKDAAGALFWFPKDMAASFNPGATVNVEWKADKWGDTPVKIITRVLSSSGSADANPQESPGRNAATYGGRTGTNDRGIFVTGIVGRAMGSGKFEPSDIALLTAMAKSAYDSNMGA